VAVFVARRRRRRLDAKSLKPSPSVPAVPPPTSPQSPALARGRSNEAGAKSPCTAPGAAAVTAGPGPGAASPAAAAAPAAGKTNVIPYSQYRKSRLDSIRNDLGLSGAPPRSPPSLVCSQCMSLSL